MEARYWIWELVIKGKEGITIVSGPSFHKCIAVYDIEADGTFEVRYAIQTCSLYTFEQAAQEFELSSAPIFVSLNGKEFSTLERERNGDPTMISVGKWCPFPFLTAIYHSQKMLYPRLQFLP